jgi:hypothetical protein
VVSGDSEVIFGAEIILFPLTITHYKKIYSFIDFLGTIGGVLEILMLVFGFFLFPIS